MDADPIFYGTVGGDVSNVHDLSSRPTVEWEADDVPCASTYCGLDGLCATTDLGFEGCVCGGGRVARAIVAPRLGSLGSATTVACQAADFDLMGSVAEEMGLDEICDSYNCGPGGSCVALNGVPHCECGEGYAAVNNYGLVTCAVTEETYGPDQLLWPGWGEAATGDDDDEADDDDAADDDDGHPLGENPEDAGGGCSGCAAAPGAGSPSGAWAALAVAALGAGPRRRRR